MTNHFHLLVKVNNKGIEYINEKHRNNTQVLSKQIGVMLSAYTQAINKQEGLKGSLFAHKTNAKQLNFTTNFKNPSSLKNVTNYNYARNCFLYIHQNPKESGLVEKLEDWEFSSFRDYTGLREGTLINKDLAFEIIGLDKETFYQQSYISLDDSDIKEIW
jgi:hypothetical protein